MNSLERVLTTIGQKEPDRVPFFLMVTMHGARELGLSIEEYFAKGEQVADGQLKMRKKYKHDCLYNFFYAPVEIEAMGGEVIFREDGPPNSGRPFIENIEQIEMLKLPVPTESPIINEVLKGTRIMKAEVGDSVPIIGVVMSPFSLPIMQMGFSNYFDLIFKRPDLFQRLMSLNENFCIAWANAQLEAGATAICYFDPFSSVTVTPKNEYMKTGFEVAKRTIGQIQGPTATHMASGRCLPIIDSLANTGTLIVGVSVEEDLKEIKDTCKEKLTVLGNLNGIEMCRWDDKTAEQKVKDAIKRAGKGGGFILADNHGEIPWQVPEEVLLSISKAVHKWGKYPLQWADEK